MNALIALFLAVSIFELSIWFPALWDDRKYLAYFCLILLTSVSIAIAVSDLSLGTFLVLVLSFYRIINLLRLIKNRIQIDHLYKVSVNTAISLIGLQFMVLIGLYISNRFTVSNSFWWSAVSIIQLIAGVIVFASLLRHLRTTTPVKITKAFVEKDLPTVTVAIPARNETDDLSDCLNSLVSSNYPKLEILVLDDCSQDRRTPQIIQDFAIQGVRFIAGKVPSDKWLAKNYAYKQLVDESSGEIIMFCGVDTRFEPNTIKTLVELLLQKNKSMVSVIPSNYLNEKLNLWSLLVQPGRYAWELALPRRVLNRPPVLSTCWMIKRSLLLASGGFEAVTNTITPESYFAKQAIKSDDYSFLQADTSCSLISVKHITDQRITAIRTRYPQLHRRLEVTAVVTILEFSSLVLPTIMMIVGLIISNYVIVEISLISSSLQYYAYGKIVDLTYRKRLIPGYFVLPIAAIFDIYLLNVSMFRYEFGQVMWKDRNICIPIMDVRDGILKPRSY